MSYNGPYSLLIRASYFISCSLHARFASVLANGTGGIGIFELLVFRCFVQKLSS